MSHMVSHLSLVQIAGISGPTYEDFYQQVNPDEQGNVQAADAARFLKRSGLSDGLLSRIWDMADYNGQGYLTKQGFFIAIKLVALAQNGKEPSLANLTMQVPAPNVRPVVSPASVSVTSKSPGPGWTIKPEDKAKFDGIFDSLQPVGGKLAGDKVKPLLLKSQLAVEILGKIWDLSDIDRDGKLDRDEFALSMWLVYKCLEGETLGPTLPPNMVPPGKWHLLDANTAGMAPASTSGFTLSSDSMQLATAASGSTSSGPGPAPASLEWVVRPEDKFHSDTLFIAADQDKDGFVSGVEIRETFLRSGLAQPVLARLWDLCDVRGTGLLNSEQFALAMYLIGQLVAGRDLPSRLTPEMVPPSLRGETPGGQLTLADFNIPRDSDRVHEEIEAIRKERLDVERSCLQFDSEAKLKSAEVLLLQRSLDQVGQTCRTLEVQKGEAQKKLDDYADQRSRLETGLAELRSKCSEEKGQVEMLRNQLNSQQQSIKGQEEEMSRLRTELNDLIREEATLQERLQENRRRLQAIETETRHTQTQIHQAQARIENLESTRGQLQQVIEQYASILSGDATATEPDPDRVRSLMNCSPGSTTSSGFGSGTLDEHQHQRGAKRGTALSPVTVPANTGAGKSLQIKGASSPGMKRQPSPLPAPSSAATSPPLTHFPAKVPAAFPDDPFLQDADPFKGAPGFAEPFDVDPFKDVVVSTSDTSVGMVPGEDPFKDTPDPFGGDPFSSSSATTKSSHDPFDDLFSKAPANRTKAAVDPFGGDAFGGPGVGGFDTMGVGGDTAGDAFGPITTATSGAANSRVTDPFGADPFAPQSQEMGLQAKSGSQTLSSGKSSTSGRSSQPKLAAATAAFDPFTGTSGGAGVGGSPPTGSGFADFVAHFSPLPTATAEASANAGGGGGSSGKRRSSHQHHKSGSHPAPAPAANDYAEIYGTLPLASTTPAPAATRGPALTEDEQLKWAKHESRRVAQEEESARRREQAELELAIRLSQIN